MTVHLTSFQQHENRVDKQQVLSPAQELRNKYYQHLSEKDKEEEEDDDFVYRPASAIIYGPIEPGNDTVEYDDKTNVSVKTIEPDDIQDNNTLFEPTTDLEPKITVQNFNASSTLLSKLSKSTAPMRAKLTTLSTRKTSLDHLWVNSSTTLTLPLRKSAESVHNMSLSRKKQKEKNSKKTERSRSFSFGSAYGLLDGNTKIHPALLSEVAYSFKQQTLLSTKKSKDSIEYHEVFDGRDAVNRLSSIIKTTDRNMAILVGRALDHQKFFHDVNYEHRLRDSAYELYQFKHHLIATTNKRKLPTDITVDNSKVTQDEQEDNQLPNGVFTLLTNCYSPTCSKDSNCYSPCCPRRSSLKSQSSLFEENEDRLWINTVSKSILSKLTKDEKRRQENIYELIYTEKDFIDDLIYVEENWIDPLKSNDSIPIERRDQFINDLFWNLPEIRKSNSLLLNDLLQRQNVHKVVDQIGDVFLKHVNTLFEPFISYGSHQVISKYIFETEKSNNPPFQKLVETIERSPKSRKLELNGYLTKPTTRLGRYNLLLREILKHTPEGHPDRESIPKCMQVIHHYLTRVNEESGKTENRFGLELLEKKLSYKKASNSEVNDLDLLSKDRKIIIKGPLQRKGNTSTSSEASELQVYVLDHCLLLIKSKFFDSNEHYKLYKKPIPLALLAITLPDQTKRSSSIIPHTRTRTSSFYSSGSADFLSPTLSYSSSTSVATNKNGYPISFVHLGRQGSGTTTLYTSTLVSRRRWVDTIERYRHSVMEKSKVFGSFGISQYYFNAFNKVNCIAEYGNYLVLGCDHGVYIKKPINAACPLQQQPNKKENHEEDVREDDEEEEEKEDKGIIRIIPIEKVSQIDILQVSKLILILADKTLYTYNLTNLFDADGSLIISQVVMPSPSISSPIKPIREQESIHSHATNSSTESQESIPLSPKSPNSTDTANSKVSKFGTSFSPSPTAGSLSTKRLSSNIKKLSNNVSFFKIGKVYDKSTTHDNKPVERTLVCYVKYSAMTSTIRALEPYHQETDLSNNKKKKGSTIASSGSSHNSNGSGSNSNVKRRKSTISLVATAGHLGLFMRHHQDVLKGFKDLYIPGEATSIQYFKNVICVGSAKGFQMVDIGSAGVQSVLDPNDENHAFVSQRETLRPISMFRHPDGCILLCYNEIAFYIDKKGRRVRPDWIINWEGQPTAFAFYYPYILAFDPSFIEIRHANTGDLAQVIPGNNIRLLRPDPSDTVYCVMDDRTTGNELVISLKCIVQQNKARSLST